MPDDQRKWYYSLEKNILVAIIVLMTALTFINVVLRSWFNSAIIWGLEATSFLFAWLVILGLGYLVRTHSHLGVDAVINLFSVPKKRLFALLAALFCIIYGLLLLKGAYDFSANFYNLPRSLGRIIPLGFEDMKPYRFQGYTPVVDIPMPNWLRPVWEPIFLDPMDAPYNKLPINIPYAALFLGVLWMLIRFIIAFVEIWRGVTDRLIASHEIEETLDEQAGG